MSTAREDLTTHLVGLLTGVQVIGALAGIENAVGPVVFVSRTSGQPAPLVGHRDDGLTVWVLSPLLDPVEAEVDLDAHLDEVLAALDAHDYLHWDTYAREVYAEAFHAYRVTLTHRTVIETEEVTP